MGPGGIPAGSNLLGQAAKEFCRGIRSRDRQESGRPTPSSPIRDFGRQHFATLASDAPPRTAMNCMTVSILGRQRRRTPLTVWKKAAGRLWLKGQGFVRCTWLAQLPLFKVGRSLPTAVLEMLEEYRRQCPSPCAAGNSVAAVPAIASLHETPPAPGRISAIVMRGSVLPPRRRREPHNAYNRPEKMCVLARSARISRPGGKVSCT